MKTIEKYIPTLEINSAGIRKAFHPCNRARNAGSIGEGDNKTTLWISQSGLEAIETNGDPVFAGEAGFEEARATIIMAASA